MRATVMYQAGDVRVEDVPDAHLIEATDALVRVSHAAICGSDLWPYKSMEPTGSGRRMGHEFIGVVEDVGDDVRTVKPGELVVSPCHRQPPASREAPDEQLPRNYRVEGRQRLLETSLASESDSQAFVVANCRAEDVRITGRIAGLTVVEVDADEVHLA
jgi:hypothetical protein